MDVPDRERILQDLLNAGTATQVEQVLDDAGIRLERSGIDPDAMSRFWQQLQTDLESTPLRASSRLTLRRLERYARAAIRTRENR